jgi:hypothetical protein
MSYVMSRASITLILVLATASHARAGEHRYTTEHFRLAAPALFDLVTPRAAHDVRALADVTLRDDLATTPGGLAPMITLLTPPVAVGRERDDTTAPLLAFGARVQGTTLVAFTRPGTKSDPDDRVVYQRLVASNLLHGRSFSVTVYEDHALGPSATQILGFGAHLTLRPMLEIHGWRAHVEIFASYDVTQGATGFVALVGHPSLLAPPAPTQ